MTLNVMISWKDLTPQKQDEITHEFVSNGHGAPDEIDFDNAWAEMAVNRI